MFGVPSRFRTVQQTGNIFTTSLFYQQVKSTVTKLALSGSAHYWQQKLLKPTVPGQPTITPHDTDIHGKVP
jgi:hypothetical protein